MKALSVSRISLLVSFALGVMILWATTVPSALSSDATFAGAGGDCECDDFQGSCSMNISTECTGSYWECGYVPTTDVWADCSPQGEDCGGDAPVCDDNSRKCGC